VASLLAGGYSLSQTGSDSPAVKEMPDRRLRPGHGRRATAGSGWAGQAWVRTSRTPSARHEYTRSGIT